MNVENITVNKHFFILKSQKLSLKIVFQNNSSEISKYSLDASSIVAIKHELL